MTVDRRDFPSLTAVPSGEVLLGFGDAFDENVRQRSLGTELHVREV